MNYTDMLSRFAVSDKNEYKLKGFMDFAVPFLSLPFLALLYTFMNWGESSLSGFAGGASFALCLAACIPCAVLLWRKKLKPHHIAAAIIVIAAVVRIFYILNTDWTERQHDTFGTDSAGHTGYIYTILGTGSLPQSNEGLFYHPPLHHFLAALFERFVLPFAAGVEVEALELLQILTAYYSLMCGWVFLRILEELRLNACFTILGFALIALHPSFIIFSGSYNNDILCILLSMLTLLFLLRWMRRPNFGNILLMGVFLGLAMMAKVSAVMTAVVIAGVFIARLVVSVAEYKIKGSYPLIAQYLAFGAVSVPLGMWYPIRNLVLFDQPFGYVMRMSESHPLFCGDKSFFERFAALPIWEVFSSPYCDPFEDWNVPLYTIKCSLFGEYSFGFPKALVYTLLILNIVLIAMSVASYVFCIIKLRGRRRSAVLVCAALSVVTFISFIYFNLSYPFGCTMDFRYIVPCLFCAVVSLTAAANYLAKKHRTAALLTLGIPVVLFILNTLLLFLGKGL
jgi:hypothetical protein